MHLWLMRYTSRSLFHGCPWTLSLVWCEMQCSQVELLLGLWHKTFSECCFQMSHGDHYKSGLLNVTELWKNLKRWRWFSKVYSTFPGSHWDYIQVTSTVKNQRTVWNVHLLSMQFTQSDSCCILLPSCIIVFIFFTSVYSIIITSHCIFP